jgi:RNA polymerase sigma factor (sigma-70 family)
MMHASDGSTSPTLLRAVADWQDHSAWLRFQRCYDPMLRCWCRSYGLDHESVDELCQVIWIELAERMRTFCYDPTARFRGLLPNVCHWRAIDFLRRRRAKRACEFSLVDEDDREPACDVIDLDSVDDHSPADESHFFRVDDAARIQRAVRARVSQRSWEAFWLVAVQDWTVEQTASSLGMTHTAVYAARARIARMLAEEGKRAADPCKVED